MDLDEVLRLDACPFDYGAMGGGFRRDTVEVMMEEKAQFALFLRYMDRFTDQCGLSLSVPKWNYCMEKKRINASCIYDEMTGFISMKRKIITELFRDIMIFCGWGIGSIRLEKEDRIPELFPENAVSLQEWEHIYSHMPGFSTLKKQGFHDITVTVCWNRALYDYHEFCHKNREVIERQFSAAEKVVARILRKTADPFALGLDGVMSCFGEQNYIMGFFEANHSSETVSILDMDYNFMVQILILYMLLICAEEMFGYRQKGESDGRI